MFLDDGLFNPEYATAMSISGVLGWDVSRHMTNDERTDFHHMLDMGGEL